MPNPLGRPLVVYDGRCGFCRRWVRRWKARTGNRVVYLSFRVPIPLWTLGVSRRAARRSMQLVEPNGRVHEGGRAFLHLLRWMPGLRFASRLGRLPFVGAIAGWMYRRVSHHRALAARIDARLFGRSSEPPRSRVVAWLFLRALGLVSFAAFTSLGAQVLGLYGKRGILPIRERLEQANAALGRERHRVLPTLFWLDASDTTLVRACRAGQLLSLLLIVGIAPALDLVLLWAIYLSFVSTGGEFLSYQWDALLLETSLHALTVAPWGLRPRIGRDEPPWQAVLLMRWLAFRLSYQSGLAKVRSGDATWKDRTACSYHYETQPLPTRIGWYAHHLPTRVQKLSTQLVLVGECAVPFLAFAPRRLRRLAFWLLSGVQGAIALTGNYGFFNMLTAVLGLWLVDDEPLLEALPLRPREPATRTRGVRRLLVAAAAGALLALSFAAHRLRYGRRTPRRLPRFLVRALEWTAPLQSISTYGLFSVMTVRRPEIAIEGSDDGARWLEYTFRYKPTDPQRPPRRVAPHQPRLDWQMWFAALEQPPPWFVRLLVRLLEGSPEVVALFEKTPFPDRPPRYVRAVLYEYRMTDLETRRRTGAWWRRELIGVYFPAVTLSPQPEERTGAHRAA